MSERDYNKEPVWKLWLLWVRSIATGTDEWQRINAAIERKTGSGRPPKRKWY